MAEPGFLQALAGEAMRFFEFVGEALRPEDGKPSLYEQAIRRDLGLPPAASPAAFALPQDKLDAIKAYQAAANPTAEAGAQALADIAVVIDAIIAVAETSFHDGEFDPGAGSQQLAHALLDIFASNYVRLRFPRLFLLLQFAALFEDVTSTYGDEGSSLCRIGQSLGALFGFLFQPGKSLGALDPGDDPTALATDLAVRAGAVALAWLDRDNDIGEKDITVVRDILTGWDGPGLDLDSPRVPTRADVVSQRMTSVAFGGGFTGPDDDATGTGTVVLTTAMIPEVQGGTSIFLALGGSTDIEQPIGRRWTFSAKVRADAGVAAVFGAQNRISGPPGGAFEAGVAFTSHPPLPAPGDLAPPPVSFSFPSPAGSRLDIGQLAFSLALASSGAEMLLEIGEGAFVLEAGDNDGFMAELLGGVPLTLGFNLTFGYSSTRGLVREGNFSRPGVSAQPKAPLAGAGNVGAPFFDATIPVGRAVGPLTVHEVALRLARGPAEAEPRDQTRLAIELDSSFSAAIGPVYFRVDQLGLQFVTDSAAEDPNLGFVDLRLGAKFPRGIAVNIETAVIAGGGAILHDPAQGIYFGILDLAIRGGTTVQAIGLVATRRPDGSKGFSLLVILTVELGNPYPLGMGFFLEGVGGLFALHRRFDETAMRAALPTGQLRNLLFPTDPVHHTAEILQAIQTLFPARRGSGLFGLLVKIGWASPTLVAFELTVIYEWGDQHRLIILGRVSATLPRPDAAVIRLNMDAVGIIDLDAGTFALDAVLYDSRLCGKFVITGAMAMRMGFEGIGFAIAVGGLHPRFAVPPGFPSVARLQLALSNGDNPKLICKAYFAITSNTVQFGADCSLYAAAFGFALVGNVGFDVLIQLAPLHFLAEFRASVQLKRGSTNLFKVTVKGEIEGPLPLRITGKATFEILWCDFSVSFNATLVGGDVLNDLVPVDLLGLLADALLQPRSWQSSLPPESRQLAALRQPATEGILLHPLGTLTVRQTVVPLGLDRDIERVGTGVPTGERRFAITGARIGPAPLARAGVRELFAPGQFFEMSDDDRLAAPSFEAMDAGVSIGEAGYAAGFAAREASPFRYTRIVVGADGRPVLQPDPVAMDGGLVLTMLLTSPSARAPSRRTLDRRFEAAVRPAAPRVRSAGWAALEAGAPAPADAGRTWIEARARVAGLAGGVVVPRWELAS